MINLRTLEIFYWAAKLKSFSRAAEKLNTTQPTVSQRIGALEETFGKELLNRATKPVSLTSAGRRVLQHAEMILRQVERLKQEFDLPKTAPRTIRLGVSETIVQTWLSSFLETSMQQFPNIDFEISVDVTAALLRALTDGELDMTFMLGPSNIDGLACHHLVDYEMKFYAAPGLIADDRLLPEHIVQWPVLTYPRNAFPYSYIRELLFRASEGRPRIFTNSSLSTIERMAIDGIGVALVAEGVFSPSLGQGHLVPLESDMDLPLLQCFSVYLMGLDDDVLLSLTKIAKQSAIGAGLNH